jgi:succinyl-diaminopimelate desuccinylase
MQEIISLTRELVQFKSMHSNPEDIWGCATFVENYIKKIGASYQFLSHNNVPSILALPQEGYAPVILMTHMDVVDGADHLFNPDEKDGRLYGRGTLDDKYAVAISLVLFKEHLKLLREQGRTQADMPFGILITGDEEVGGHDGVQKAFETFETDFCIAIDGGDLNTIVVKEKGILRLKLIARGKAAHGARPWLGENAIEKLMRDYQKIHPLFNASAIEYPAPEYWHRTLNLGIIQGGKSSNQVPDYAEAELDIRYTEFDDVDALLAMMRENIEGEVIEEGREPLFLSGQSPYLDLLLKNTPEAQTGIEHGASDARHLSRQGVPGVVWGADGDASFHAVDEHVEIQSVYELYARLDRFMKQISPELRRR